MKYQIIIRRNAQKQIIKLGANVAQRIQKAIDDLADDPRPAGAIQMVGSLQWRLRVGDYRVIYEIVDDVLTVTVVEAGHRSSVYRGR